MSTLKIGVFASGRGSNFAAILKAIQAGSLDAKIQILLSNHKKAGALELAEQNDIPTLVVDRQQHDSRESFVQTMVNALEQHAVEWIVLAGYMKKIPPEVIARYANRIVNIHPALLPSFGGKGMYGHFVHEAVLAHGCKVSGVTVHLVDDAYDRGPILAQRCVPVLPDDTPDTLAARVLQQEHLLFSEVLQWIARGNVTINGRIATVISD